MSAQVTLTGSASWTGRGYQFKKGKPLPVHDEGDVKFFEARKGEFFVQRELKVKAVPEKAAEAEADDTKPAAKTTAKRRSAVRRSAAKSKKGG